MHPLNSHQQPEYEKSENQQNGHCLLSLMMLDQWKVVRRIGHCYFPFRFFLYSVLFKKVAAVFLSSPSSQENKYNNQISLLTKTKQQING